MLIDTGDTGANLPDLPANPIINSPPIRSNSEMVIRNNLMNQAHLVRHSNVTYSQYVNGSIAAVPKITDQASNNLIKSNQSNNLIKSNPSNNLIKSKNCEDNLVASFFKTLIG